MVEIHIKADELIHLTSETQKSGWAQLCYVYNHSYQSSHMIMFNLLQEHIYSDPKISQESPPLSGSNYHPMGPPY